MADPSWTANAGGLLTTSGLDFSGDVAHYPDYRLRIKGVYAATPDDKRVLVAPSLWGRLKGAAWEAVKDLDPETDLRVRSGFARLLSVLDENYEWESSSELSKVIDEYFFMDGRLPGESITALLARNRSAMRRFTKIIQSHYNEAADVQFQSEMKRWRELRSDYIYELEEWRQRNPRQNVFDQRLREPRDDGADGAVTPPAEPRAEGDRDPVPLPEEESVSDASNEIDLAPVEPPKPRPTPPVRFFWPGVLAGHLFLRRLSLGKDQRASLLRSTGGSSDLKDLEKVLRVSEAEIFHKPAGHPQQRSHQPMPHARIPMPAKPIAARAPMYPAGDDALSEVEADHPSAAANEANADVEDFDAWLLDAASLGADLSGDPELAECWLGYQRQRDKLKRIRRERGWRPPQGDRSAASSTPGRPPARSSNFFDPGGFGILGGWTLYFTWRRDISRYTEYAGLFPALPLPDREGVHP